MQLKEYTQGNIEESNTQTKVNISPKEEVNNQVSEEDIGYVD